MTDPTEPRDDSDRLLPCPFCEGEAEIQQAEDGMYFVGCLRPSCLASSRGIYACGDDPRPLLLEAWNRRPSPPRDES